MTASEGIDRLPTNAPLAFWILTLLGGIALTAGLYLEPDHTWIDLFVVSNYLIGLGLSGLLLIALHYVTGARWSLPVRPVYEAMTAILPLAAVGLGAVLLFRPALYSWAV